VAFPPGLGSSPSPGSNATYPVFSFFFFFTGFFFFCLDVRRRVFSSSGRDTCLFSQLSCLTARGWPVSSLVCWLFVLGRGLFFPFPCRARDYTSTLSPALFPFFSRLPKSSPCPFVSDPLPVLSSPALGATSVGLFFFFRIDGVSTFDWR